MRNTKIIIQKRVKRSNRACFYEINYNQLPQFITIRYQSTSKYCFTSTVKSYAPAYLSAMLSRYEPVRPLRSSDTGLLDIPDAETKTHGEAAFSFYGPRLWNGLPVNLRLTQSFDSFKRNLKTHLFSIAFNQAFSNSYSCYIHVFLLF